MILFIKKLKVSLVIDFLIRVPILKAEQLCSSCVWVDSAIFKLIIL